VTASTRQLYRCVSLGITLGTLAVLEIFLRVANFAELRETVTEKSLTYDYDAELGWMPVPYSSGDGSKFLVGIQYHDEALASYLEGRSTGCA
jgi:hypothetical protein